MTCFIFSVAVFCLALAGLCLMVGWKSGASQLARIAVALVIGSAIVSWFEGVLRAFFARPGVATAAGSVAVLLLLALILLAVGWFWKRRTEAASVSRPTIRRRAALADTPKPPESLPARSAIASTDDLNLFGGGQ